MIVQAIANRAARALAAYEAERAASIAAQVNRLLGL